MKDFIPSSIPNITGNEGKYLQQCIETTFVSSVGQFVNDFEKISAEKTGFKYGVAVSSGTVGLHLGLHSIKKKDDDKESLVILPDYTFIASANAIALSGAKPWLFDIREKDLNLDLELVDKTLSEECFISDDKVYHKKKNILVSSIMPVFAIGQPINFIEIQEFRKKWPIPIIIDAAGAIGCMSEGKKLGSLNAECSVISFNGNKTFTSGGGGMVLTNKEKLYTKLKHLSSTARNKEEYIHDQQGFNYRMTNLQAAVGVAQLERFDEFLDKKKEIFNYYQKNINIPDIRFIEEKNQDSSRWLSFFVVNENSELKTKDILNVLKENDIEGRSFWVPMHLQPPYKDSFKSKLDISSRVYDRVVILPSSTNLANEHLERVVESINSLNG